MLKLLGRTSSTSKLSKKIFFKHYLLESKIPVYLYINSRVQLFCHSNPVLIKLIFFCLFNHSCFNQFFLHSWTNYWNIILIQLNFITSANPTSERLNFVIYFLELRTNNFLKKNKRFWYFIWTFFCFKFFLHLFFTAVQLQIILMSTVNDTTVISMIWTCTRNFIIYLQIIYPCVNKSINQLLKFCFLSLPTSLLGFMSTFHFRIQPFLAQTPPWGQCWP